MSERPLESGSGTTAGFFSRMVAFFIDLILLALVAMIAGLAIGLVFDFFRLDQILGFLTASMPGVQTTFQKIAVLVSPFIFLLIILYFAFFWTFFGFTPGKALLGLKIVRRDGKPLSFGRSILRFLCYWVSAIPLFLGFIWILIDRRHEGWHDKLASTNVVYAWRKPPPSGKV